jgi:putative toxin-antitoxin system antitoxin component (TIGR02293 family)
MAFSAIRSPTLRDASWPASICQMAGTNEAEAVSAAGVLKLPGGHRQRAKRLSPPEVRDAVRNGLPYSSLEALQTALDLSLKELGVILGIPERTIARRRDEQHLTAAESDRLYRVARTLAHAASVLGTIEKARLWLKRPNRALGDETPLTLLDTDLGARQVEETLLRIVYGIHS